MAETILNLTFPEDISYGSTGGPGYNTDVVTVSSGVETRNVNWTQSRHRYNAAFGIRTAEYLKQLIDFFHQVKGRAYGFKYKDWNDYSSSTSFTNGLLDPISDTDQALGTGDGSKTDYQIYKNYDAGGAAQRNIVYTGELVVSLDGTNTTAFNVSNGIITFNTAPANGVVVKAGYDFYVPCRFDTDELSINLEMYQHGTTDVPIVELKL